MPAWEPAADRGIWALCDPRLSNPNQDEKEVLLWSEELGSICSSLSPSPTHFSHTTNINPFENKVWEIYFYKEVCSFIHWSSSLLLTMFPLIFTFVYVLCSCMWLYNNVMSNHSFWIFENEKSCQFIQYMSSEVKVGWVIDNHGL